MTEEQSQPSNPPRDDAERRARDRKWFEEHQKEIFDNYPGEWVLIYGEKIVAHSSDPDEYDRQVEQASTPGGLGVTVPTAENRWLPRI